ncbi:uncharacterized protein LOC108940477 [Scleropages formosus]|uniref:uncharacterized protein LOC108940477 n=1 Tax=Scleropages formosus TaxID=113540 RepID=UPI0010FA76D8|nr:uncharacterized protein LOC108940477 [Scleropages formosus]
MAGGAGVAMGNERRYGECAASQGDQRSAVFVKTLQSHQAVLSKSMSSCLVDVICSHLSSKRTVSEFEGQVVRSQPTDLQKASQLLQMVLRKGSEVCQQFYQALERFDPRLFEKVTGSPATCAAAETPCPVQHTLRTYAQGAVPTYIVNIHNSTLTNCIIGNNNGQSVSRDQQCPPPQGAEPPGSAEEDARGTCTCGHTGAEQVVTAPPSLLVHSSNLEYVIIGDSNSLAVEERQGPDELEQ